MSLRALLYLAILSALSLAGACATAPPKPQTAETFFKEGESAFAAGKYQEAIDQWKKVRESYSSPELTTQAELKIADAHFDNEAYIEAAAAYEDFRKLHPGHEKDSYVLYRLGLSHYKQIERIDTDQTPVKNAVLTLEGFLDIYPDSPYAAEVREKLADCRAKQLEYENYVGNFYLRTKKYPSAIKRLTEALESFPKETPKRDQTLFYLAKAQQKAGNAEQSEALLKRLAAEYPASPYIAEGAKLVKR